MMRAGDSEGMMAKKRKAKKRATRTVWLKADTAALKQYSRQKLPIAKVVKLMKRSAAMLRTKASLLGLPLGHQSRKKKRRLSGS